MYEDFFGFRCKPFNVTPDPDFIYYSEQHKEALAHMLYGVQERRGFILVTGRVGSGKTTLCRAFLRELGEDTSTSIVLNSNMGALELLRTIAEDFGIDLPEQATQKQVIDALNQFVLSEYRNGRNACVIVDESQNLSPEALEELRLLSNIETEKQKLLQTILVGQPELENLLNRDELRQLKQRIAVRSYLSNLNRDETREYMVHRLEKASDGGSRVEVDDELFPVIHEVTDGNPRAINLLGDRMLMAAYLDEERRLRSEHLQEAIQDLSADPSLQDAEESRILHRLRQHSSSRASRWWGEKGRKILGVLAQLGRDTLATLPSKKYLLIAALVAIITVGAGWYARGHIPFLDYSPNPVIHLPDLEIKDLYNGRNLGGTVPRSPETVKKKLPTQGLSKPGNDAESSTSKPAPEPPRAPTAATSPEIPENTSNAAQPGESATSAVGQNPVDTFANPLGIEPLPSEQPVPETGRLGGLALARYVSFYIDRHGGEAVLEEVAGSPNLTGQYLYQSGVDRFIPNPLTGQLLERQGAKVRFLSYGFPVLLPAGGKGAPGPRRLLIWVPELDRFWDPVYGWRPRHSDPLPADWRGSGYVLAQATFNLNTLVTRGDTGTVVTRFQKLINAATSRSVPVSGTFDETTRDAVIQFQKQNNLPVDGVGGPITYLTLLGRADRSIDWDDNSLRAFVRMVRAHVTD